MVVIMVKDFDLDRVCGKRCWITVLVTDIVNSIGFEAPLQEDGGNILL